MCSISIKFWDHFLSPSNLCFVLYPLARYCFIIKFLWTAIITINFNYKSKIQSIVLSTVQSRVHSPGFTTTRFYEGISIETHVLRSGDRLGSDRNSRVAIGDKCTTSIVSTDGLHPLPHPTTAMRTPCASWDHVVKKWLRQSLLAVMNMKRSTPSMLRKHNKLVGLKKRSVSQLLFLMDVFMKLSW